MEHTDPRAAHPPADTPTARSRVSPHTKGYANTSDEVWDRSPICSSCRHAWPCEVALVQAENDALRALLEAATPSRMGGTPDLFGPDGYDGDDPWGDWEADVFAALEGER